MKCPECGSEVGPGEQFCGNCGAPVEASEALPVEDQERFGDETVIAEAPVVPPLASEEPSFAPPPPPPPMAGAGGEGKKKTGMIIAIVAIVVILLCCCCVAAVAIFLNSEAGQDILYELDLAMRPVLTTLV